MNHKLKISPLYFRDVINGKKTFELRKDDRNIQVGDTVLLQEYDVMYTGREEEIIVTYVLRDCPQYGLMDGYCIIGFMRKEK